MCLYPKLILNKKYLNTKKNKGQPPPLKDNRVKWVAVGCGKCLECRRMKSREWQCRLNEEIQTNKGIFVTLSFSPEALQELSNKYNIKNVNVIATKAVRLFLERYRKVNKKSLKHWLITELGSEAETGRIHLHGIIFKDITQQELDKYWQYGNTYIGTFCNIQTINYIVKYVTKIDFEHRNFEPVILCSKGLGRSYINKITKNVHKYRPTETKEFYTLPNGAKINLPIYYRNHIYTEEQKEKLWIERIEKQKRYIRGVEVDISTDKGWEHYMKQLHEAQKYNTQLGYGDDSLKWKKQEYLITAKMLNGRSVKSLNSAT